MKALAMLMSGMAFLAVSPTSAQTEQTVLRSCAEPGKLRVARGALVRVECDSAFVYNKPAELVLRRKDRVNDSLNRVTDSLLRVKDSVAATLRALVALRDSINAVKSAVILELRQIHQIEQRSYDSLRVLLQVTDTAARASVANTDRALSYVRKVKAASYIASGLAGGVVGGFGIKPGGESGFHWSGFGVGAAVGVLTNWLLMKVVR
ncbi:MAG: hypothetical protein E6H01_12360 [Bacillati bacterium ANGP1]|uniref:Uncharacterized protein n=1 Tax=Candidatus Segetimicrobium genomatis TaxID=2569760 RepID=A0A537KRP6_9BACT|nr:MAG: hypothetical protein E6H01_12360 [Terrabacteria group bacterium ANGP1]